MLCSKVVDTHVEAGEAEKQNSKKTCCLKWTVSFPRNEPRFRPLIQMTHETA